MALNVSQHLKPGGFTKETMEFLRADRILQEKLGYSPSSVVVVYHSDAYTAQQPEFQRQVTSSLQRLRGSPHVVQVISPYDNPRQISKDGHTAYALVGLDLGAEEAHRVLDEILKPLEATDLRMEIAGSPVFYRDIQLVSERDLRRAELISLPVAALALLFVFRSAVAAALPGVAGAAAVAATLASLYWIARVTDMSIFVMNLATMLGLGLGTDYSLFLTSRFREELVAHSPRDAVALSLATAGRAVFFSGITVMLGLLGLSLFDIMALRSVGVAGALVVSFSLLAALSLTPALLAILGHRINWLPILPSRRVEGALWERIAEMVMDRPVAVFLGVMALLVGLGIPFLGVRLSLPDARVLPPGEQSRRGYELLASAFPSEQVFPVLVVAEADGPIFSPRVLKALYTFTHFLAQHPYVSGVESVVDIDPRLTLEQYLLLYTNPERIPDPYTAALARELASDNTALIRVMTPYSSSDPQAAELVHYIRQLQLPEGLRVLVGGGQASAVDIVDYLYAEFPRVALFIALATFLVLTIMLRSLVLPAKAILMNLLSITASYGALVTIFQHGVGAGLIGAPAMGYVEATIPIIMFCVLFGLSMDYEVFLLSRIRELYLTTQDNRKSVSLGLQRSGQVITSAALIVILVSLAFVSADIVLVKALGLGMAIAIFIDATIVRALLAPATMRLLGEINWWMPRWIERFLPKIDAGSH
jgi:RND superfamily putative drug exporter